MGLFSNIKNKMQFESIEELGTVKVRESATSTALTTVTYQKATPKQAENSTFTLLKDNKILQKDVESICASFVSSENNKKFSNKNLFAVKCGSDVFFFSMNGKRLDLYAQVEKNALFKTTQIGQNPNHFQVAELKTGKTFFVNFDTGFISEPYKMVNQMENGGFKVWKDSKPGFSGLYYLDANLCPISFIEYQKSTTTTLNKLEPQEKPESSNTKQTSEKETTFEVEK